MKKYFDDVKWAKIHYQNQPKIFLVKVKNNRVKVKPFDMVPADDL